MTGEKRFDAPGDGAAKSGPVTRRELEQLQARREQPAPAPECNLGGASSVRTRQIAEQRRAAKEHYIESRLRRVDGRAEEGFTRAGLKDRAKKDFERSR
jgi:hypothetical protein